MDRTPACLSRYIRITCVIFRMTHHECFTLGQFSSHHLDIFYFSERADRHGVRVLDLVQIICGTAVLQRDHKWEVEESLFQAFLPVSFLLEQNDGKVE